MLFLPLYARNAMRAIALLFGAITAVSRGDLMLLVAVAAVAIVTTIGFVCYITVRLGAPFLGRIRGVRVA